MKLAIILLATFYGSDGSQVGQVVVNDFKNFKECEQTAEKTIVPEFLSPGAKVLYTCTYGGVVTSTTEYEEKEVPRPQLKRGELSL